MALSGPAAIPALTPAAEGKADIRPCRYTRDVFAELSRYEVVLGIGIIGRVVAKVQRRHLAPRTGDNNVGQWD